MMQREGAFHPGRPGEPALLRLEARSPGEPSPVAAKLSGDRLLLIFPGGRAEGLVLSRRVAAQLRSAQRICVQIVQPAPPVAELEIEHLAADVEKEKEVA